MNFEYNKKSTTRKWLEHIGIFVLIFTVPVLLMKLLVPSGMITGSPVEEHGYFDFVAIGVLFVFIAGYYVGYQVGKNTKKPVK